MFFEKTGSNMDHRSRCSPKSCSSRIYLSNELLSTPNEDRMKKLHPWEVDVSTTPIGAQNTFGVSSSKVRVLEV